MKIVIPTILTATVLIAGFFAFQPIEKASTVHLATISSLGATCVTDSITLSTAGGTIDADQVLINFGQPVTILSIRTGGSATLNGDTVGFDANPLIDNAASVIAAVPEDISDTVQLITTDATALQGMAAQQIRFIVDDDDGTALDNNDVLDFVFCAAVSNPTTFTAVNIAITQTAA